MPPPGAESQDQGLAERLARLRDELGADRLAIDPAERLTYETDAGLDRGLPDGIFYPENGDDVARMVSWAKQSGVPVVARGAGTGLAGGAVAERGGVIVATTRMDRIEEIDTVGRSAVVEVGVTNLDLATRVAAEGLYYPPDPSSGRSCVIGGNLATNAGGPHCFKYGVTANYVTGLELVTADGVPVSLGGRAADAPGYDLTGLVVGSEGTLGMVTKASVRLLKAPPAVRTMTVAFDTLEAAGAAVSAVISTGLVPATLEAIDRNGMRVIEQFCQAGLPVEAGAVLIVDVDGYEEGLDAQTAEVAAVLERHGGRDTRIARSEEERERIWYGRKSAAGAMARLAPSYYLTDVTVRRSRLAAVLARIRGICERHGLRTASFFHAGDGNLHPLIPGDPSEPGWLERVERAMHEIVELCVLEDGSITGEHGVGIEKRDHMLQMCDGAELSAMRDVQLAFDPDDLFNPGKVLPAEIPEAPCALPAEIAPRARSSIAPVSAEKAAGALRALAEAGHTVRIGSTADGDPDGADVWFSTSSLRGIQAIAPDDLYLTVGSGTAVAKIESFVRSRGFALPLAAPWEGSSAGGLVATNLNSPRRMRYGGIRDLTLCATVALADGRVVRAGRPLVKNVAGYDLPKLFVGSHGTLGVLVDVTFKLAPAPRALRTLRATVESLEEGAGLARKALSIALIASGIVLDKDGEGNLSLLYTAEGLPDDVELELEQVSEAVARGSWNDAEETSVSGQQRWTAFLASAGPDELLTRTGVPVSRLDDYLGDLEDPAVAGSGHGRRTLVDYAAGLVWTIERPETAEDATARLEALRQPARERAGYAVAVQVPHGFRGELDVWGDPPGGVEIMRRLKDRFDPTGILEPGALVLGGHSLDTTPGPL